LDEGESEEVLFLSFVGNVSVADDFDELLELGGGEGEDGID